MLAERRLAVADARGEALGEGGGALQRRRIAVQVDQRHAGDLPHCVPKTPEEKKPELRIRIRIRIHMLLGLLDPDPDPLVLSMDPDPAPAPDTYIIKRKIVRKTLIFTVLRLLFDKT